MRGTSANRYESRRKAASLYCHTDEQRWLLVGRRPKVTILVTRNWFSLQA
jgi:hypothetical protein